MRKYLPLIACCLAFKAYGACSSDSRVHAKSIRRVALQQREPETSFYYRAEHHAILLESATVRKRLEEQFKRSGALSDGQLLRDIDNVQRGAKYTDLFAFAIKNPMYLPRIELLVATMLEHGEATVVDVYYLRDESGWMVSEVERLEFWSGAFSARRFCTSAGDLLIKITDSIG